MTNTLNKPMSEMKPVTPEHTREALEDMDDYARMDAGVDAKGPREVLERFIAEHERVMVELRELSERIVARSQHCENTKDAIAMQEHAAELDAILRESDAQVPVAATLDDAAADPALTLDVARELLRDAAAGIRRLAASATPRTEAAEGREAVAQVAKCAGIGDRSIFLWTYPGGLHGFLGDHPVGTKLYAAPPAAEVCHDARR